MSTLAFLVRGRSVDLVAMTAFNTLKNTLGVGDEIVGLLRDDLIAIEGIEEGAAGAWVTACQAQQHWFNPNKHRFAAFLAADGAAACVREDGTWPAPWLRSIVSSDRPDLTEPGADPRRDWIGVRPGTGTFAVPVMAWDREDGVGALPGGHWPDPAATRIRGVVWTLVLRAASAEAASVRAEGLVATRARRQGLLVHPHMQGWTAWGDPLAPLSPVS